MLVIPVPSKASLQLQAVSDDLGSIVEKLGLIVTRLNQVTADMLTQRSKRALEGERIITLGEQLSEEIKKFKESKSDE